MVIRITGKKKQGQRSSGASGPTQPPYHPSVPIDSYPPTKKTHKRSPNKKKITKKQKKKNKQEKQGQRSSGSGDSTDLSLCSAALSRCLRFLNQLETWVVVRPVASASSRFSRGDGYGLCVYQSLSTLRDFSLKQ